MEKRGRKCLFTSAVNGNGISELIEEIAGLIRLHPRTAPEPRAAESPVIPLRRRGGKPLPAEIVRLADGSGFRVSHANLEKAVARIDFGQEDALNRFARLLKRLDVEEALENAGAVEGDKVYIGEAEFDFQPDKIQEA
jgi:GTP-binding protein